MRLHLVGRWVVVAAFLITTGGLRAEIPRPEHPRPDLYRANWMTLNGEWQFEHDKAADGEQRGLTYGMDLKSKITVPFCPESNLSGLAIPTTVHMKDVWYRRTFTLPAAMKGQRVRLHFGGVDYRSWVYVNGQLAGSHVGESVDFKFEITSANPIYTSATASGNDLLHLTASSSPFAGGTFTSGNIISIYLNNATITNSLLAGTNTTFSGGFFVDGTYGLAAALNLASFAYYTTSATLGTGSAVDYNGISYYSLNSDIAAKTTLSDTTVTSAGFTTGTVATGTLLTFNAVPEPSAQSMLAVGMAALVAVRAFRRGREDS